MEWLVWLFGAGAISLVLWIVFRSYLWSRHDN
jgi:hypothetical protein